MGARAHTKSLAKWVVDRALVAVGGIADGDIPYVPGTLPRPLTAADWATLRSRCLFFGHQSVGKDILDGVRELALAVAEPPPRIVSIDEGTVRALNALAGDTGSGLIAEARIGGNGDPLAKIEDFANLLRGGAAGHVDAALMKLCYVDIGRRTHPGRVFEAYQRMMDELAREFPHLMLLHATVPLTTGASVPNVLRGQYNSLLRAHFPRDRVVDIAAMERGEASVDAGAQGRFAALRRETLDPALSTDGGHLNDVGRLRVASGFLVTLAAAGGSQAPSRPDGPARS